MYSLSVKEIELLDEKITSFRERIKELENENLKTQYRLLEKYIYSKPKVYRKRNCNWVIVQEFLQYNTSKQGSTSSIEKCIILGINPDSYEIKSYYDYANQLNKGE